MFDDIKRNKPVVIGITLLSVILISVFGWMLFGPEPIKKAEPPKDFIFLGGPSNQNPYIHDELLKKFNVNFVPGYSTLGTSDMIAFKPGGKDSPIDFTKVEGAQFGSVESAAMKQKYPDGLPTSDGTKKSVVFSEVAFTSPVGFFAKQGDWNELLRVGVTVNEGQAAFLPPQNMLTIEMGVNRSTYWHNVCNIGGSIQLVKREVDKDPKSKIISTIKVNANGEIIEEEPVSEGTQADCLNISRQMIVKFASGGSSGGKNALAVWAMYQPYNPDCTLNNGIIPGSSPTKEYEIPCLAPSLKTLSANSGLQEGNSLVVVQKWATSKFNSEVLAFGYVNAAISVAYNDISEADRQNFLENTRAIYLYYALNSEHEWVCFTKECVDLYQQMKADPEFMKFYAKVTGFNIGYDQVPDPQATWQISDQQFGLINIVPSPTKDMLTKLVESMK